MDITKKIREIIESKLAEKNIILYNVEYIKEDGNYVLRITIDKDGTIDIDDCVDATNIINPILDEYDLIKESYILDVTSKGIGDSNEW